MLENIKFELHELLYKDEIDELALKKNIYLLLRECIKEKMYEINIGSYELNIQPKTLSVKYNTEQTIVEVSNEDVYFESTRDTETRFFCISEKQKDEYPMDIPLIRVTGSISNITDICEEHYLIELYTDKEDNIKNYLKLPSNIEISNLNIDSTKAIMVHRRIKRSDNRTDVIDFFDIEKIRPVYLDTILEKYIQLPNRKEFIPKDYTQLIPTLEDKKKIVRFIYGSIVDFYTEYLNK